MLCNPILTSCSWCGHLTDVTAGPARCEVCGHQVGVSRAVCACPGCLRNALASLERSAGTQQEQADVRRWREQLLPAEQDFGCGY